MPYKTPIKLRKSAFKAQHGYCCYCERAMWQENVEAFAKARGYTSAQANLLRCTAEHLTSRESGGTDTPANVAAACWYCNSRRHRRKKPFGHFDRVAHAREMRRQVRQWIGIPVCVGIADTKTLAKLANHCAKKGHAGVQGVCDFGSLSDAEKSILFSKIDVGEIWGIGRQLSKQLVARGINTVEALRTAETKTLRREFSVTMERIVAELNGEPCIGLEDVAPAKQQIMSSRSFGRYLTDIESLQEAVASYVAIAAAKLRHQGSVAGMVQVFIRTSPFRDNAPQYAKSLTIPLPTPSDDTLRLTRAALWGLRRIFRPGFEYQKAGVMLMDLLPAGVRQQDLFSVARNNDALMQVVDRINGTWGRGTVRSAAEGTTKAWAMKRERMSPRWTTRWDEVPCVVC